MTPKQFFKIATKWGFIDRPEASYRYGNTYVFTLSKWKHGVENTYGKVHFPFGKFSYIKWYRGVDQTIFSIREFINKIEKDNAMSDLKHQNLKQLQYSKESCEKHISELTAKINGQKERLRWINKYIEEKTPIECWLNVYEDQDDTVYFSEEEAKKEAAPYATRVAVHMKEVSDE